MIYFIGIALTVCAQEPVFEVASVKPSESQRAGSSIHNQPGGFSTEHTTLAELIQYALPAQDFQFVEGPGWIRDARFDIIAKFAPADSDKMDFAERITRIRTRLRHLLEDRFQLQVREEQREVPVYALETEKTGVRMKAAEPRGNVNTNGGPAGATLSGKGLTMRGLADILSGIAHRPVNDETGLSGAYDVELSLVIYRVEGTVGTASQ